MTGRVVLVRHGETAQNAEGRFVSSGDPPLTDRGRNQARLAGKAIAEWGIESLFCSAKARALETAELIGAERSGGGGLAPVIDERLSELGFGELEDAGPAEIAAAGLDEVFAAWRQGRPVQYPPGAEHFEDAAARAMSFWTEHIRPHSRMVVVSHSHFLRVLICVAVLGVPAETHRRLKLDTGRLAVVEWEFGVPRLVALNAGGS